MLLHEIHVKLTASMLSLPCNNCIDVIYFCPTLVFVLLVFTDEDKVVVKLDLGTAFHSPCRYQTSQT